MPSPEPVSVPPGGGSPRRKGAMRHSFHQPPRPGRGLERGAVPEGEGQEGGPIEEEGGRAGRLPGCAEDL
eukprot:509739-Alexandrium_andersonii.AAC.1